MIEEQAGSKMADLIQQIQDKSVQLTDLEVILEDYQRERRELLQEICRLKAALWELIGDAELPGHIRGRKPDEPLEAVEEN
ncbi:MAG: hypothetical protein M1132_12295 [Chloroflexi bacterium]|nr:hypothetical protein [Chloroflexota bacterium]